MEFNSLTLLGPHPVHEEPVLQMHHEDRSDHQADNSKRGNASKQSNHESESAKQLRADDQQPNRNRYSHVRIASHGDLETIAAKPAQHPLRPMSEEHHSQNHAQSGQAHVVVGAHQPLYHGFLLTGSRPSIES